MTTSDPSSGAPLPVQLRYPVLRPDPDFLSGEAATCPVDIGDRTYQATCPPQGQWARMTPFLDFTGALPVEPGSERYARMVKVCAYFLAACLPVTEVRSLQKSLLGRKVTDTEVVQAVRFLLNAWWPNITVMMVGCG